MLMSEIISWHLAGRENITIYEMYLQEMIQSLAAVA